MSNLKQLGVFACYSHQQPDMIFLSISEFRMTIDKARELLRVQTAFAGGYNRNAAKLILKELHRDCDDLCVDQLIQELRLEEIFGIKPGSITS